ncbi:MAG: hypothetical protein AB1405_00180 [Bdellovibrionota bacterium]
MQGVDVPAPALMAGAHVICRYLTQTGKLLAVATHVSERRRQEVYSFRYGYLYGDRKWDFEGFKERESWVSPENVPGWRGVVAWDLPKILEYRTCVLAKLPGEHSGWLADDLVFTYSQHVRTKGSYQGERGRIRHDRVYSDVAQVVVKILSEDGPFGKTFNDLRNSQRNSPWHERREGLPTYWMLVCGRDLLAEEARILETERILSMRLGEDFESFLELLPSLDTLPLFVNTGVI